jgi:hypothetical protein
MRNPGRSSCVFTLQDKPVWTNVTVSDIKPTRNVVTALVSSELKIKEIKKSPTQAHKYWLPSTFAVREFKSSQVSQLNEKFFKDFAAFFPTPAQPSKKALFSSC